LWKLLNQSFQRGQCVPHALVRLRPRPRKALKPLLAKVRPAAEGIIANLRSISVPPAEIEVEFSIKLSAGAGAFIASAGGEAHYRIHLKWQRE
jgi:Trypsin-co-occurring domain 1